MKKHHARFPSMESHRIEMTAASMKSLYDEWVIAVQFDDQQSQLESVLKKTGDAISSGTAEEMQSHVDQASRRSESAYLRLRDQIKTTQNELKDYIEKSDALDRKITR